jgi:hypothetical protein
MRSTLLTLATAVAAIALVSAQPTGQKPAPKAAPAAAAKVTVYKSPT